VTIKLSPMKWFVILSVIAIGLALGLSPNPQDVQQLHTTATAYRLAIAVLLIPYVLIWYAGFYAYAKLLEYSKPLKGTQDGDGFRLISLGMGILAFSLVVPIIISLILNNIAAHNHSFQAASTITDNYLELYPGLIGFLVILNGARLLLRTTKLGPALFDVRWNAPWFLLLSVVFSHLVIDNFYHSNPYHLTLWLLVVTFIVPFLYGWAVGLLGAYNLRLYAKVVKGALYRLAIRQFATGIAIAIIGSIAIQFVNITLAQRKNNSLLSVLLIDYGLLIIVAVGLVMMALSTKKLKKIEEV